MFYCNDDKKRTIYYNRFSAQNQFIVRVDHIENNYRQRDKDQK